ncbi:MAG TPA: flavin reductase [Anditalea sp.]|nr:flavin reductase [Anditalea sp.]
MHLTKAAISQTEKIKRLNIINSISGVKPANLIGTASSTKKSNLAIFSSVIHLGSDPALLGFILRPKGEQPRHTYENILETGYYTINQVHEYITAQSHFTAAKFDKEESEFEKCKLTEEFKFDFHAPFVKESLLKIGMKYIESIPIEINGTTLVIGEIQHLEVEDDAVDEEGYIDYEVLNSAGIVGLNNYYTLKKSAAYPYPRPSGLPNFIK